MEEYQQLATVSRETWRKMLILGHKLDLNKGGLYDARLGCVNLWAGPENHPEGWERVNIKKMALNYPRSYVGAVYGEYKDNTVELFISVTPYDRAEDDAARELWGLSRDEAIMQGRVPDIHRWYKDFLKPTEAEWRWVQEKVIALKEMAEREIEPLKEGLFCPLCEGWVKVLLFNDFIAHLQEEHKLEIYSVTLAKEGWVLETNIGRITV